MAIEKVTIGNATLYLGDCLDVLPILEPVDCILSTLPAGQDLNIYPNDKASEYPAFIQKFLSVIPQHNLLSLLITKNSPFDYLFEDFKDFKEEDFINFKKPNEGTILKDNSEFKLIYRGIPSTGYRDKIIPNPDHVKDLNLFSPMQYCPEFKYFINCFTATGETVLDPGMGVGTTGIAAIETGRKFIGIELVPETFEQAVKRFELRMNK